MINRVYKPNEYGTKYLEVGIYDSNKDQILLYQHRTYIPYTKIKLFLYVLLVSI